MNTHILRITYSDKEGKHRTITEKCDLSVALYLNNAKSVIRLVDKETEILSFETVRGFVKFITLPNERIFQVVLEEKDEKVNLCVFL